MRGRISTYVSIDTDELLDELSNADIQQIAQERGIISDTFDQREEVERLVHCLERRNVDEALVIARQLLKSCEDGPRGPEARAKEYGAARRGKHPFFRVGVT